MAKKREPGKRPAKGSSGGQKLADRNYIGAAPEKTAESLAPSDAKQIKLHHRMAGID